MSAFDYVLIDGKITLEQIRSVTKDHPVVVDVKVVKFKPWRGKPRHWPKPKDVSIVIEQVHREGVSCRPEYSVSGVIENTEFHGICLIHPVGGHISNIPH